MKTTNNQSREYTRYLRIPRPTFTSNHKNCHRRPQMRSNKSRGFHQPVPVVIRDALASPAVPDPTGTPQPPHVRPVCTSREPRPSSPPRRPRPRPGRARPLESPRPEDVSTKPGPSSSAGGESRRGSVHVGPDRRALYVGAIQAHRDHTVRAKAVRVRPLRAKT